MILPVKLRVGQHIAIHILRLPPGISPLPIYTLSVHSPAFFPKPLPSNTAVANTDSCVGPQNKIGRPAHRYRQLMQVPVLSAR